MVLVLILLISGCSSADENTLDFEITYWQPEVRRLADLGCDMMSQEAIVYRRCILEEMISDYEDDGSVGDWWEYQALCSSYRDAIPGCQGTQALLGSGTFNCTVSGEFFDWTTSRMQAGWVAHDGVFSFPISFNFEDRMVGLSVGTTWKATLDMGSSGANYYEYSWNGASEGSLFADGWFESSFTLEEVRVFTVSWDDSRDEHQTGWESHIIGFISDNLNRAEICWCNGPGDWANLASFRQGGKDNLFSACPCPHPGVISCNRSE